MLASEFSSSLVTQWSLPVSRWAIWGDARTNGNKPDLPFVDPMLRRRLSPLARAAFHVAQQCSGGKLGTPLVYASRHGELERTLELFQAMATNEPLSPTTFGLSVLNANAGLYSIARKDKAATTALAAGNETFGFGLIEAWSRVQSSGQAVLYVYADAPPPSPLAGSPEDQVAIFAIGLLIDPAAEKKIRCSMEAAPTGRSNTHHAQALAFASLFEHSHAAEWSGGRRLWRWCH